MGNSGCVWYVGRDGTERDEAFRPAFGAPKMGGTGCSTGQILSVFEFHLPPWNGFVPRLWNAMFYHFKTNIPHVFFKNYTFVPSRPVPFRPVPSRPVPFRLRTKRTLKGYHLISYNDEIHGRIYVVPRPLQFYASTFDAVCGKQHKKLCRFSFIFSPLP
ncbi:hypothetical protein DVH24_024264 [Malus domestica]|uniref:Uncharacterized protein n=1 Tax=Malus domestica TaxID=3750 RepID=A0A498JGC1_MALDO|nr:hypothetical protein DVH24_024264 [Malus domestica]